MELYVYTIGSKYYGDIKLKCKAIKASMYGFDYYFKDPDLQYDHIHKTKIGTLISSWSPEVVILTEKNDDVAKSIISDYYNELISFKEKEIQRYKDIIEIVNKSNIGELE